VVYAGLKATVGLRLSQEEEYEGADLSIHRIHARPGGQLVITPLARPSRDSVNSKAM
jgi:hypothetical protein